MKFPCRLLLVSLSILGVFTSVCAEQTYRIDFSNDETLKAIFDSGLRPWRMPGMEIRECKINNVAFTVKLTAYELPVFKAQWLNIGVLKDGKLTQIEAETERMSIEEARKMMTPYLTLTKTSNSDMEKFFLAVRENPMGFKESFGVGVEGWPRFGVYFKKTFSTSYPLAMGINVNWNRRQKDYKFLETPNPAPARLRKCEHGCAAACNSGASVRCFDCRT